MNTPEPNRPVDLSCVLRIFGTSLTSRARKSSLNLNSSAMLIGESAERMNHEATKVTKRFSNVECRFVIFVIFVTSCFIEFLFIMIGKRTNQRLGGTRG